MELQPVDIILDTLQGFGRPVNERELVCAISHFRGLQFDAMMDQETELRENFRELCKFGYIQQTKPGWYTLLPLPKNYDLLEPYNWNNMAYSNLGFLDSSESGKELHKSTSEREICDASYETLWDYISFLKIHDSCNKRKSMPRKARSVRNLNKKKPGPRSKMARPSAGKIKARARMNLKLKIKNMSKSRLSMLRKKLTAKKRAKRTK